MFPRNPFSQKIEICEIEASNVVTVDEVLFSTCCILLAYTTVFRDDGVGFPLGIENCEGACGWVQS